MNYYNEYKWALEILYGHEIFIQGVRILSGQIIFLQEQE